MSLECHGGDDVEGERKRRGEVKQKFRESEIVMGHENKCPPFNLPHVQQSCNTHYICCASCLDIIALLNARHALIKVIRNAGFCMLNVWLLARAEAVLKGRADLKATLPLWSHTASTG